MATADTKILKDLGTLREKMDLCDSMLSPGDGVPPLSVKTSEAMLAVIGFLEACAPRMIELVEAAASGALSETVFEEVLMCNDRLQKQLTDIETVALTETPASTTVASAAGVGAGSAAGTDLTAQFDDLLLGPIDDPTSTSLGQSNTTASGAGLKSTGEEGKEDVAAPAPGGVQGHDGGADNNMKPPAVQKSSSDDEFDAFFNERQTG
mmetsp:Transcript_62502/g.152158  ORF Transcript_62502/g.152158 Transcript_62502/m.152158 type:complete len:208 (+) Transcript_62502:53-676(+)